MDENRAWICHGSETSEHEDLLIGNRPGLQALQSAIQRALADGEAGIREPGIEYLGVRVVETDPRGPTKPVTLKGRIAQLLLILFVAFLVFALFVGIHTIESWR